MILNSSRSETNSMVMIDIILSPFSEHPSSLVIPPGCFVFATANTFYYSRLSTLPDLTDLYPRWTLQIVL